MKSGITTRMEPISGGPPLDMTSGVYLFSEGDQHLYVGRAKNITNRYDWHCIPFSDHNRASFAFKLAREATANITPSYRRGESSRTGLMLNPTFVSAFIEAKARIRTCTFDTFPNPNRLGRLCWKPTLPLCLRRLTTASRHIEPRRSTPFFFDWRSVT